MLKKIALCLCFTLFLGLLSACSPNAVLRSVRTESTPLPSLKNSNKTATNTPGSIGTPIALPPRFDDEPLKPGQTPKKDIMPNGLPALSPMKGINYDTLFAEKIRDKNERFERVENAVIDFRKEFETYKPAIVRLAAVESDIQNLIKELEVLLQETPTPKQPPLDLDSGGGNADAEDKRTEQAAELNVRQLDPQPATPPEIKSPQQKTRPQQPQPQPQTPTASPPPPAKDFGGRTSALNLRIGKHSDKLRIAFDINKNTPFNIELDNDEHLLIIELPQASWEGKKEQSFPSSALLETLNVEPINGEKGSMIVISLRKDTKILQRKHLSPDKTSNYHRVYFDLKL